MAENKAKPTDVAPEAYLASIEDMDRRRDCEALAHLMAKVSKQEGRMWGSSIVGFGTHKYKLASGRYGEICTVGFSSRKTDISIYGLVGETPDEELLARLGKHRRGKGCLYVRRMSDIDTQVLEKLVENAINAKAI